MQFGTKRIAGWRKRVVAIAPFVLQCSPIERGLMVSNAVVRARIDSQIKDDATVVLAAIGLTVSDVVRILLVRIAHDKALPFEPLVPNKKTIAAMKASRSKRLKTYANVGDLMAGLNEKD